MRMNPRPTLYLSKEEFKKWRTEKEEENKYRRNPHKFNIVIFKRPDESENES